MWQIIQEKGENKTIQRLWLLRHFSQLYPVVSFAIKNFRTAVISLLERSGSSYTFHLMLNLINVCFILRKSRFFASIERCGWSKKSFTVLDWAIWSLKTSKSEWRKNCRHFLFISILYRFILSSMHRSVIFWFVSLVVKDNLLLSVTFF